MPIIGAIGVPIFFVISGFVIALQSLKGQTDDSLNFLAKRVSRIVPIYWLMTIAFVLIEGLSFDAHFVQSMVFVATGANSFPVLGPGWSLEYEMFFYLLFAGLVLSGLFTRSTGVAILLGLLTVLVSVGLITGSPLFYKIGNPYLLEFAAGIVAAHLIRSTKVAAAGPMILVVGLAAVAVTIPSISNWPTTQLLWGAGAFLIVLGLAGLESRGTTLMKSAPFQILGDASYSIYLVHLPLQGLLFPLVLWQMRLHTLVDPHFALAALIVLAAVVGIMVHYAIERPLWHRSRAGLLRVVEATSSTNWSHKPNRNPTLIVRSRQRLVSPAAFWLDRPLGFIGRGVEHNPLKPSQVVCESVVEPNFGISQQCYSASKRSGKSP